MIITCNSIICTVISFHWKVNSWKYIYGHNRVENYMFSIVTKVKRATAVFLSRLLVHISFKNGWSASWDVFKHYVLSLLSKLLAFSLPSQNNGRSRCTENLFKTKISKKTVFGATWNKNGKQKYIRSYCSRNFFLNLVIRFELLHLSSNDHLNLSTWIKSRDGQHANTSPILSNLLTSILET